jgi:hypothetical protein
MDGQMNMTGKDYGKWTEGDKDTKRIHDRDK